MIQVIFLKKSWSHMGSVSGYTNLASGFSTIHDCKTIVLPDQNSQFLMKLVNFFMKTFRTIFSFFKKIQPDLFPYINSTSYVLARNSIRILKKNPSSVLLISAGEDLFCKVYLSQPADIRSRVFAVFHQPPSWFKLIGSNPELLGTIGGVICLGSDQSDFFRRFGLRNVITSRHGVDVNFFSPKFSTPRESRTLLFVGNWLRDFELLEESISLVWKIYPDLRIKCVIGKVIFDSKALFRLASDWRTEILVNISDNKLLDLYRTCTLVFLPLTDAVANNALLEAAACFAPLVVTDLPATREYLSNFPAFYAKVGDAADHANCITQLLREPIINRECPQSINQHADFVAKYSWNSIASELLEFIEFKSTT